MADILSTSVTGLLAFQQALDVTSNNVSNVSTPGYSVETINLTEAPGQNIGGSYIGGGVEVSSITRAYDELLAQQVRSSQASYSSFNTLATQAGQVDNMLSDSSTGLTATLQSFVNALQTVASTSFFHRAAPGAAESGASPHAAAELVRFADLAVRLQRGVADRHQRPADQLARGHHRDAQ